MTGDRSGGVSLGRVETSAPRRGRPRARYAICGLSRRAVGMFALPLLGGPQVGREDYSACGDFVAILDIDRERVEAFNARQGTDIPVYGPDDFDRMVSDVAPDVVIVAGPDASHATYIVDALRHDLDVIAEKPMVTDCVQARAVRDAEQASRGSVRVTFNMRYRAPHRALKQMLLDGLVGRVTNVEFTHNLDTYHGASYFYRWNRDRQASGGMSITKSVHDFDLINWLLDDWPEQVFAYGALNYYGPASPYNPSAGQRRRLPVAEQKLRCPYYQRWNGPDAGAPEDDPSLARNSLPTTVQYPADRPLYLYDDDIAIEDTYSAVVRYEHGASMVYSANFSAPWEGYVLGINGTEGRLETVHYSSPGRCPFPVQPGQQIIYYPLFGERQVHETRAVHGSHGGADPLLRRELFSGRADPTLAHLGLAAGSEAGAYAVAAGEATWRSVEENRPVDIGALLSGSR